MRGEGCIKISKYTDYYDEWVDLYVNKKLSARKIAEIYGCHQSTVKYALKQKGVSFRSISEAVKEAFKDDEIKEKLRNSIKNAFSREESKQRLIEGQKKAWADPEKREKRIASMTRPEVREKISKSVKKALENTEIKEKVTTASKKALQDPEVKRKMSDASKKKWQNPEYRLKVIQAWQRPEVKEKMLEGCRLGGIATAKIKSGTSIEIAIAKVMDELNINYIQQKQFDRCIVDFYLPEYNLIIECDGDYWHNLPGARERDRRRDAWLKSHGYVVVRIWEHEIKKDAREAFLNAIKEAGFYDIVGSA